MPAEVVEPLGVREKNIGYGQLSRCEPGFGPGGDGFCDVLHFWSHHPGGGNFAFADASVRFLRYDTDLSRLATRAKRD